VCRVDGEDVIPQEGDFYGGWKTRDVTGGKKGMKGGERRVSFLLRLARSFTDSV